MDQSQRIILTPFNSFEWKDEMEIFLREKFLYMFAMATDTEPNAAVDKIKWHNRRDEAYGLLCIEERSCKCNNSMFVVAGNTW